MRFLNFILLLLVPPNTSGGCQPNIRITGQKVCTGQDFNITCQFDCYGHRVKLMKGEQVERSLVSANNNALVSKHIHGANKSHSGIYSCRTEPPGLVSKAEVTVEDCGFTSAYVSTVNTTSSSLTNSTHQSPPLSNSKILKPVLIWYLLFKAGFFLIGSITAALTTVCRKH